MSQKDPIIEATVSGDIKRVRELIKLGVDLDVTNDVGASAVNIAAMNNNYEIFRILAEAGADLNKKARNNQSAIDWARAHNNAAMLKIIDEGKF